MVMGEIERETQVVVIVPGRVAMRRRFRAADLGHEVT